MLGCDVEYHSGTKFIGGHHDLMAGIIGIKNTEIADKIFYQINARGAGLAPFDCFLLMRGVKTLPLRIDRQQSNAGKIAKCLQDRGVNVFYPGLESHPDYELHASQASGAGAVLAFSTGDVELSKRIVEGVVLFTISVSFGCVNSLISMPGMNVVANDYRVYESSEYSEACARG